MKRPTIADIAEQAGVSTGAVSYALNDRPGVSAETRARTLITSIEKGRATSLRAGTPRLHARGSVATLRPAAEALGS